MTAWKSYQLRDICELNNGRAYGKDELLQDGKYPVLRVGNFFTNKNWYYSNLELNADKYCDTGDLLYAWSASFGPQLWHGGKVIYHYHIWKIIPDANLVDKFFLYYLLLNDVEKIKAASGTGATMMHVTKKSMDERQVLIPPLAVQQAIVAKLDAAFASIEQAIAAAERNAENAKQLFQSYLSDVFEHRDNRHSDKGVAVMTAWTKTTLGKICKVDWGNTSLTKKSYVEEGKYAAVSATGSDGRIDFAEHKAGTPVLSAIGAQCGKMFLPKEDFTAIKNTITLTPYPDICSGEYLFHLFNAIELPKRGAAQPFISKGDIQSFEIAIPSLPVQKAIVAKLDELITHTIKLSEIHKTKSRSFNALKQSLLQQAFNGQLVDA